MDIPGSVARMGSVRLHHLPRARDSAAIVFRAHLAKDRHFVPQGLHKLRLNRFGTKAGISRDPSLGLAPHGFTTFHVTWDSAGVEFGARPNEDRLSVPVQLRLNRFGPKARISRDLRLGWVPYGFSDLHVLGIVQVSSFGPVRPKIVILPRDDSLNYD